jgi:hypothetical protein
MLSTQEEEEEGRETREKELEERRGYVFRYDGRTRRKEGRLLKCSKVAAW